MRCLNPQRSKNLQDRKGWIEGWESKIKADEFIHGLGIGEAYLRPNGRCRHSIVGHSCQREGECQPGREHPVSGHVADPTPQTGIERNTVPRRLPDHAEERGIIGSISLTLSPFTSPTNLMSQRSAAPRSRPKQ